MSKACSPVLMKPSYPHKDSVPALELTLKVGYSRLWTISKTHGKFKVDYMCILKLESTHPRSKAQNSESYVHQSVIDLIYFFSIFLDSVEFARRTNKFCVLGS